MMVVEKTASKFNVPEYIDLYKILKRGLKTLNKKSE